MNVTDTNWSAIVNAALQSSSVEGAGQITASATQGTDGNLTVTFKGTDGKSYTFTAEAPELDAATGVPTPEALQTLTSKLDAQIELCKQQLAQLGQVVQSTGATASSTGTNKALFDIYALMNLMLEIAKEQRENARTERQADLNRATADIKSQADIQRSAARLGMWMSIGMSTLSIGLQAGSMIGSLKAQGTAIKMEKNAGLDNLQGDLKILTATDGAETQQNLNNVRGLMTEDQYNSASQKFGDTLTAKGELTHAQQTRDNAVAAREEYMTQSNEMQGRLAGVNEQIQAKQDDIASLEAEVEELQEDVEGANDFGYDEQNSQLNMDLQSKQQELQTARDELSELQAQRETIIQRGAENDPGLAEKNQQVANAETALKTAQDKFAEKASADMTRLDGEIAQARIELGRMTGKDSQATKVEIDAQKQRVADLEQQRTWGRAYVTDAKMDAGMKGSIAEDIQNCETVIGQKTQVLHLNAEYKQSEQKSAAFLAAGRMAEQLGTMLNTVAKSMADVESAQATEMQAESKVHENMQAESDDLAQSAKQLLQSVIQLLQQILEAENQSIRQIVA